MGSDDIRFPLVTILKLMIDANLQFIKAASDRTASFVILCCLAFIGFWGRGTATLAQTTAFSYQGYLEDGGAPASGTYDLRFKLYDAETGGTQTGATVTKGDVQVTNGVFDVELDFGTSYAEGMRWIEMGVRPGSSSDSYTTLSPRSKLSPAPVALSLPGVHVDTGNDRVGIGTTSPGSKLTVAGSVASTSGGFTLPDGTVLDEAGDLGGGLPTTGSGAYDLTNNDGLLAGGTLEVGSIPATGAGVRMMWYPRKAAFRAGGINGSQWDGTNIGVYSVATGLNTEASGGRATAMGQSTTASGNAAAAMGFNTTASGTSSMAMGINTTASNNAATAMGGGTTASGINAVAMGFSTTAQARSSLVIGRYNTISGDPDTWNANDPLFVAGNGTGSASRSNALLLEKDGDLSVAGRFTTDSLIASTTGGFMLPDGTVLDESSDLGGGGNAWSLGGNSGLDPATDFLGTTDGISLEIKVNSERALRIEPTASSAAPNLIGGHPSNGVGSETEGATIAGGGFDDGSTNQANTVTGDYGSIGGGRNNTAASAYAVVGGGWSNEVQAGYATIAGGGPSDPNDIAGTHNIVYDNYGVIGGGGGNQAGRDDGNNTGSAFATVSGGKNNVAFEQGASVGGGIANTVSSERATIGGGEDNTASTEWATVAGGFDNAAIGSGGYTSIGGGHSNTVSGAYATVGGGLDNSARERYTTVAGGRRNVADANYATISGGGPSDQNDVSGTHNVVYDQYGVIGGGGNNQAGTDDTNMGNAEYATVGGGKSNQAKAAYATIAGGGPFSVLSTTHTNVVYDQYGSIGGGAGHTVGSDDGDSSSDRFATVGGGQVNEATAGGATVAGGAQNRATGPRATIGGGHFNQASGIRATIPGGESNEANGENSFAAGSNAIADHDGAFVWADNTIGVSSTAANQFIVFATGGMGIGSNSPQTQLDVRREVSGVASTDNHVAYIENTATSSGDVLALKSNMTTPDAGVNYVTFKRNGSDIGAIEGNGSGGVNYKSGGGDYAEMLPRLHESEPIEAGDIVGVHGGKVTRRTDKAQRLMVVSDRPAVVGNMPPGEAHEERYETVAFVGQVAVKVRGPVETGDLVVASGREDGTGRAIAPEDWRAERDGPVVGRAWEGADGRGVHRVTVAVGLDRLNAVVGQLTRQQKTIRRLRQQVDQLRALRGQVHQLQAAVEAMQPSEVRSASHDVASR